MGNWIIERYRPEFREEWDRFVTESRNGTFLFMRGYMDYHADRFKDCSWMVRKGGKLMAMLPANITPDNVLHSHQGLTYGGWILPPAHVDAADVLEFFSEAVETWRECGITELDYRPVPWIYARQPSEEAEYALFRLGALMVRADVSSSINQSRGESLNQQMRRHLAKAQKLNPIVSETDDIEGFMWMLAACLQERHGACPVHTVEEMRLLKSRFPDNIRFFYTALPLEEEGVQQDKPRMEAGVCVYDTGRVAHAQYIATTVKGRELNLLTPLFHKLITETFRDRAYFDFGTSNENGGLYLNAGLLRQKFSYGATAVLHLYYRLKL